MTARAKSSNTPYSIWIHGTYLTEPPIRPNDGAIRPKGHYIDKGGYPGANVYSVNMDTYCEGTGKADKHSKEIFDRDILLYEMGEEFEYFLVQDGQAINIAYGEVLELGELRTEDIKVIGNTVDTPEFIEGIGHCIQYGEMPYIPALNVQITAYPYFKLTCEDCKKISLSTVYTAHCKECGGFYKAEFTTEIKREMKKALA